MRFIQKVSATPLSKIAKVIDSLASGDDKTTNAPSIRAVNEAITNLNTTFTKLDSATRADITRINNTLESHTMSEGSWTPPDAPLTALVQNEQIVFLVPLAAIINATRVVAEGTVTVYYQGQWYSVPMMGKSTSSFSSLGIVCHVDATGVTTNGDSFPTDTTGIAIASSKAANGILFKFS